MWQKLTSERIPLNDIEQAVYKDNSDTVNDIMFSYDESVSTDNLFYIYRKNTHDSELADFLSTAKELENAEMKSIHRGTTHHPEIQVM